MDVGIERTFSPQNFSMLPWESVDDLSAMKSEDVGLIVRLISFQTRFSTYVVMIHQRHRLRFAL